MNEEIAIDEAVVVKIDTRIYDLEAENDRLRLLMAELEVLEEGAQYHAVNLESMVKHLKVHINHIRKVHDYQDQQGNEVTLQLRVAIVNASEFSRREQ